MSTRTQIRVEFTQLAMSVVKSSLLLWPSLLVEDSQTGIILSIFAGVNTAPALSSLTTL